jgi:hypothetical protein
MCYVQFDYVTFVLPHINKEKAIYVWLGAVTWATIKHDDLFSCCRMYKLDKKKVIYMSDVSNNKT